MLSGVKIAAYDPEAMPNMNVLYGDKITFGNNAYDILNDADCLLICTEWSEFTSPNFNKIKALLKSPVIFDGRNIFDLEQMAAHGFYYESVGRKIIDANK